MQTDFEVTKTGAFGKPLTGWRLSEYSALLFTCIQETGAFRSLLLFDIILGVQHLFVRVYLQKKPQLNIKYNQNSVCFNFSSWTFYLCPDKCTSTIPLHWGWEVSFLLTLFSIVIFRKLHSIDTFASPFTSDWSACLLSRRFLSTLLALVCSLHYLTAWMHMGLEVEGIT